VRGKSDTHKADSRATGMALPRLPLASYESVWSYVRALAAERWELLTDERQKLQATAEQPFTRRLNQWQQLPLYPTCAWS